MSSFPRASPKAGESTPPGSCAAPAPSGARRCPVGRSSWPRSPGAARTPTDPAPNDHRSATCTGGCSCGRASKPLHPCLWVIHVHVVFFTLTESGGEAFRSRLAGRTHVAARVFGSDHRSPAGRDEHWFPSKLLRDLGSTPQIPPGHRRLD